MACMKCEKYSKDYVLCKSCLEQLKKDAWKEMKEDFEKQYNEQEEPDKFFKNALYEVGHNYCYEDLTEEKYKEILFDEYASTYYEKLVGAKLYTIKTGKEKNPKEAKLNLLY